MRDVGAGEELITDYALFDDSGDQMECQCRTASCRGVISGRDWQRPDLRRKYGSYFSTYLLDRATPALRHAPVRPNHPAAAREGGNQ